MTVPTTKQLLDAMARGLVDLAGVREVRAVFGDSGSGSLIVFLDDGTQIAVVLRPYDQVPERIARGAFDGQVGREVPLSIGGLGGPRIGTATVTDSGTDELRIRAKASSVVLIRALQDGVLSELSFGFRSDPARPAPGGDLP